MDTPCLVIDLATVHRNIARQQALADAAGLAARPHIKTHKLPQIAKMQLAAGAKGITCQKIGEAEIMADAGIDDILITYNIIGPEKLDRLAALAQRITLSVVCDNASVAEGLSARFALEAKPLAVLIECDTGAGRCGVQTPEAALELAQYIHALPGLALHGLMTYPPLGPATEADAWLKRAKNLLIEAGLPCPVVSSGGTPNMGWMGDYTTATEHRAGTYIYNDRSLIARGVCTADDCAGRVHATIVSRPTPSRAIIDAGSKALTSDLLGLTGFGLIVACPEAQITGLSEEHGVIELNPALWNPSVGDEIEIIPNHVCPVTNLLDTVILRHEDGRLEEVAVAARGKVR